LTLPSYNAETNFPNKRSFIIPNGDVYKAIIRLRATRNDIDICVVSIDWGCAVIRKVPADDKNLLTPCAHITNKDITYDWFEKDRERLLNLKTPQQFMEWLVLQEQK